MARPPSATPEPRISGRRGALIAGGQCAVAAAVAAAFEGLRLLALDAPAGAALVAAGCAWLAALGAAGILVALAAVAPRLPWPARWRAAWRETPRPITGWRVALAATAIAVLGAVTYRVASFIHVAFRFNEAGPVALLLAGVVVAAVVLIGGGALLLDSAVVARLEASSGGGERAAAARGGGRRWAGRALIAIALVAAPALIIRQTVSSLSLAPVITWSVLVAAVWLVRSAQLGARRGRALLAAAALLFAAGASSLVASTRQPMARGAATGHGVLSKLALAQLWRLGDGDGDGYAAASFGGADCDDGDAARSPAAFELAGNGVDENCSGGDGAPAGRLRRVGSSPAPSLDGPPPAPAEVPPRPEAAMAGFTPQPNIVLVSFDALRADHLGVWGYRRDTSPALDSLAAKGVRFSWAMTSCPSTRCAIPALLTGRYASALPHDAEVPTLASTLAAAGWDTATITCCDRFTADGPELAGFELVDSSADALRQKRAGQSNSDQVVDKIVRWLERRKAARALAAAPGASGAAAGRPFFLWTHFYDPHAPYQAPKAARRYGDSDLDRYDAEIRFADEQLARLLYELDRTGALANTILVVTADHGDEFGEHGIRFHARSLFNQVVRVPLVFWLPAGRSGLPRVVETPVSLVDVMPTILELAHVPAPPGMNGHSLAAAVVEGKPAPERPVLIELVPDRQIERDLAAIVWNGAKAIWDREANAWSLYSLRDAGDSRDLVEEPARRAELAELQRLLGAALDDELGVLPGESGRRFK